MNITAEQADTILTAAKARASAIGVPVNIAVLDAGIHLKAFVRMDGAVLGSIDKPRTAALFQASNEAVWNCCKAGAPAHNLEASNGGLMPFAGSLPLFAADGVMIGAVGVSGGAVPHSTSPKPRSPR
jgi:uncharacterized protein GlcG (DUF336 family)